MTHKLTIVAKSANVIYKKCLYPLVAVARELEMPDNLDDIFPIDQTEWDPARYMTQ